MIFETFSDSWAEEESIFYYRGRHTPLLVCKQHILLWIVEWERVRRNWKSWSKSVQGCRLHHMKHVCSKLWFQGCVTQVFASVKSLLLTSKTSLDKHCSLMLTMASCANMNFLDKACSHCWHISWCCVKNMAQILLRMVQMSEYMVRYL